MFRHLLLRSSCSWLCLFLQVPGSRKHRLIFTSVELNWVEKQHCFSGVWMLQNLSGPYEEKSLCDCFISGSCS